MRSIKAICTLATIFLVLGAGVSKAQTTVPIAPPKFLEWALTPPMGWNSWDCFGAGVTQTETLANADYMERNLKAHGWNIITIDIQWYEPLAHTDRYRPNALLEMDANGRLLPAGNRFPMTRETHSFKAMGDALHARGLRFGLHLLRGIPRQAVKQNVSILGTIVHAGDIADKTSKCPWNGDMYGVDMSKPGAQEYYDSVFALLASWDLDLVKVDDLSAPYHTAEIEAIRKAIDKCGRPIIFSTSPGATPVNQGRHIQSYANMWRISNDFWDDWPALYSQFARLNNWTPFCGPGHFPDADMLPLGNIRAWQEKNSWTQFTHDEQRTMMTLWSIARSPLIVGANLPQNDAFTLSLLTNDEVIAVDQDSTNNKQIYSTRNQIAWVADVVDSKDKYLAIFNAAPAPLADRGRGRRRATSRGASAASAPMTMPASAPINLAATQPAAISVPLADLGLSSPCSVRDLWAQKDIGIVKDMVEATVPSHGAVLYRIHSPK
ncbi:MAG: glycoside hydrolase family 27 protein [Planctomycetota bacterium]|nr:glycoside hydrolase family 27 protein [Planctomycetota bacterium]